MVLHRPIELAPFIRTWPGARLVLPTWGIQHFPYWSDGQVGHPSPTSKLFSDGIPTGIGPERSPSRMYRYVKTIPLVLQMPAWHTTPMSKPTKKQKNNRSPEENRLTQYLVTESAREGGVPDAATRAQLSVLMSAPELVSEPEPQSKKKRKSGPSRPRPSKTKKRK